MDRLTQQPKPQDTDKSNEARIHETEKDGWMPAGQKTPTVVRVGKNVATID
jgi:hypothetical protein